MARHAAVSRPFSKVQQRRRVVGVINMCRIVVLPSIEQAPPVRPASTVCYVEVGEGIRASSRAGTSHRDLQWLKTSGEAKRQERGPRPERRGYSRCLYSEAGRLYA